MKSIFEEMLLRAIDEKSLQLDKIGDEYSKSQRYFKKRRK